MMHELQNFNGSGVFITLTYADENLPKDGGLQKRDLQLFFKRFRRTVQPARIKYYASGEYGEKTGRPHYHAIVFGHKMSDNDIVGGKAFGGPVLEAWAQGHVYIGSVTYDSCRYVADYIQKKYNGDLAKEKYGSRQAPFQTQSLGLGKAYIAENKDRLRETQEIQYRGVKMGLPRYYSEKLELTKEQKAGRAGEQAKRQIQKLEKQGIEKECGTYYFHIMEKVKPQHDKNLAAKAHIKALKAKL